MPQDWQCPDHGKGLFIAGDPAGYSFFGKRPTPHTAVRVNRPASSCRHSWTPTGLEFITARYGLASNRRFENVDREDLMNQAVLAGIPADIEEYLYTFTDKEGRTCKGFTFGMSIGTPSGLNWSFRDLTVTVPVSQFNAWPGPWAP